MSGRDCFDDLGIDGAILKFTRKKYGIKMWADSPG